MKTGKYIVIEGHDGTGKSTQVEIIRQKLLERGIDSIEFHEPGSNPIAEAIKTILKDGRLPRDGMTNLLLFSASRHETWKETAIPALKAGKWVVASRNYYSSIAFQGYGEGIDLDLIKTITLQATDEHYVTPDISVILDLDDKERVKRIKQRGELKNPDNFESKDDAFQSRVKNGYLKIAKMYNIPIVSANPSIDEVSDDIWQLVEPNLEK